MFVIQGVRFLFRDTWGWCFLRMKGLAWEWKSTPEPLLLTGNPNSLIRWHPPQRMPSFLTVVLSWSSEINAFTESELIQSWYLMWWLLIMLVNEHIVATLCILCSSLVIEVLIYSTSFRCVWLLISFCSSVFEWNSIINIKYLLCVKNKVHWNNNNHS